MSNVVVFDLDGVITSEEAYWITAGLVLHELAYSPRYWNLLGSESYVPPATAEECDEAGHEVLPRAVMLGFKARAINSNWDTCYAAVSLCLVDLLARIPDRSSLFPLQPWDADWIAAFRHALSQVEGDKHISLDSYRLLDEPLFQNYVGFELFERLNQYASELFGQQVEGVFARYSPFWMLCQELFQESYLGDQLYEQEHHHAPSQQGRYGCIYLEQSILPAETLRSTLQTLREQGYTLGVATGRPGREAIVPLQNYGLYEYFDAAHIMTHTEVAQAEEKLLARGDSTSLVKPHPYQFLAAANPDYQPHQAVPPRGSFIVIGDTTSDVRGGQAAGALVVAVLTGALTDEARRLLEESQPDFMIPDVTRVPELLQRLDDLATIQRMQFLEREKAEILLRRWFMRYMDLEVDEVKLTPRRSR
ncbi:HAD family hydrolase [Dictyobacter kobayashii]|uniref:Haloacid dehalogenase n=1 Tax=Dictyobacter kobayashii TaxID=2014872 RepID=A0A402ABJ9_9CHLR|nr:HAD hydrolase-like protein [Dictyobacter kobayashii]GCE16467.1 haloacid dehalogenase [Dictyobacter kobayashii]